LYGCAGWDQDFFGSIIAHGLSNLGNDKVAGSGCVSINGRSES